MPTKFNMKKHILLFLTIFLSTLNIYAQQKTKVACIGNSVTFGYGHENPAVTSYPSQLAVMLGDDYEVGNFGKSGATLLRKGHRPYNEQEEFKKALEFAPDIAIIHLGLNDTDPRNWKYYKREFISDYISLIEAIENVNPDVEIFICRMTPIFHWHHRFQKGTRDWYWEIQATIENIAENIAEVKIIDLQELLYHRPDLMPDALHPNEVGAELIAKRVYSAITGDFGGLSVPKIYSDNMVIQHGVPFIVKGTANANDDINVRFNKKTIRTQADDKGKWTVCFDTIKVDGKRHKLTITSKNKSLTFKNILVGEVILCSGNYKSTDNYQQSTDFGTYYNDNIRLYYMEAPNASKIVDDIENMCLAEKKIMNDWYFYLPTAWQIIDEDNFDYYASSYLLASKISDSLQMPVGLIYNVIEDVPIESFIDRKTLEWHPSLLNILYEWRSKDNTLDYCHPYEPSYFYYRGITQLSSFSIGSVIWYMKHSEVSELETIKMSALIESWQRTWNSKNLPFIIR